MPPVPKSLWIDRRGERHGRLVVTGYAGRDAWGGPRWHCRCDCGATKTVGANHLIAGDVTSCGCAAPDAHRARRVDLVGEALPGGDRVIVERGEVAVLMCSEGHTWEMDRTATRERRLDAPEERRALSLCPLCGVNGTIDLRGEVFGLLTVLERAGNDAPSDGRYASQATWRCRCDCGVEKALRGGHLRRGEIRTCGASACRAKLRGRDGPRVDPAVTNAIRASEGRIAHAAEALGLSYCTLWSRLRKHPELWPEDVPRPARGRPRKV